MKEQVSEKNKTTYGIESPNLTVADCSETSEDYIVKDGNSSSSGMRHPLYSILFCGQKLEEHLDTIADCLHSGIKVIWIGNDKDLNVLIGPYGEFIEARLLQCYRYVGNYKGVVIDGDYSADGQGFIDSISTVEDFNLEQYGVEHSSASNIIVRASAGTGKTSVMVDRILFLLHVRRVDPASITMITFTNDATNQMMVRLQEAVIIRYKLTRSPRYLSMLEDVSRIQISTIDSFSHRLLGLVGNTIGYSNEPSISSDAMPLSDAIDHALDDHYINGRPVRECLGANLYDATRMIKEFHYKLASKGYKGSHLEGLDWGDTEDAESARLQKVLKETLSEVEKNLADRRFRQDTAAITDLEHELIRAISLHEDNLPELNLQCLFIDEFQDTSDDQIRLISELCRIKKPDLFVVGDPKQSIYRFRGADDSSFDTLVEYLPPSYAHKLEEVQLVRNYRTDKNLLTKMNPFFESWVRNGKLMDFDPLRPCRGDIGGNLFIRQVSKDDREKYIVRDIRAALRDIHDKKDAPNDSKVMVLVRTNGQLDEVASICERNNIPMVARRDRPLFLSDASRDIYSLLCSYLYPADTVSQFNFLTTPYCRQDLKLDFSELESYNGSSAMVSDYLENILSNTVWPNYKNEFKMRPALSVLRDIMKEAPVIENYGMILRRRGISDPRMIEYMSKKYKANLDKVLSILHRTFVGDGLDLPHMCEFLRLAIATNRDEVEVDLDPGSSDFAYGMTIHKAKGLEFDTVILPYDKWVTDNPASEIVISDDGTTIGWRFYKKSGEDVSADLQNSNFAKAHGEDLTHACSEETRILYVAMTRAIRNLVIYKFWTPLDIPYSWSALLEAGE